MHAETLKNLYDHLLTAKNVLDIGTGSGYVTACMAHICPEHTKIYSVDHIKEINDFAKSNIKKISPHFLRKDKIHFVTQDGR
jgi:protein-L-isoaspartate(D-aspartate) O-methyltransferase